MNNIEFSGNVELRSHDSSEFIDQFEELTFADSFDEEEKHLENEKLRKLEGSNYSYQNEMAQHKLLSAKEEYELGEAIKRGDEKALSKLVQSNLRLVISIVKHYRNRGMEMDDLIQEGSLGLIQAARKFDPKMGCRFSTYATWWVRQAAARASANKGRTIRLPVHLQANAGKIKNEIRSYLHRFGRYPTLPELTGATGISADEISRIFTNNVPAASLDDYIDADRSKTVEESVESDSKTESLAEKTLLRENIDKLGNFLSLDEKQAVFYFYGLYGVELSTAEIALRMNKSVEEVRKLIRRSLKRLKRCLQGRRLSDFIED